MSTDRQPGAPNALRGLVIVVIAGVLGLFLLARGGTSSLLDTSESGPVAGAPDTTVENVPTIAPSESVVEESPESTEGAPAAEVSVAVYNATGGAIPGAAGEAQDVITPLGYEQISLADAPDTIEASAVYFADGFEANAQAIADALGYGSDAVAPAEGAENNPGAGAGTDVVVVVGTDAADGAGGGGEAADPPGDEGAPEG